jgi:O-methyltransferase
MIGAFARALLRPFGLALVRTRPRADEVGAGIPDQAWYTPRFSPWVGQQPFRARYERIATRTLVSDDRCWVLASLLQQVLPLGGEVWECGVYRGGTARLLAETMAEAMLAPPPLRLFDTFAGMPAVDAVADRHMAGDFADTSESGVAAFVGHAAFVTTHAGRIPETLAGHEHARLAFVHVDVDIKHSVHDCCAFAWPRLVPGGVMVFDDYGFASCPGAREAVDAFFADAKAVPLVLPTGQAIVWKRPA